MNFPNIEGSSDFEAIMYCQKKITSVGNVVVAGLNTRVQNLEEKLVFPTHDRPCFMDRVVRLIASASALARAKSRYTSPLFFVCRRIGFCSSAGGALTPGKGDMSYLLVRGRHRKASMAAVLLAGGLIFFVFDRWQWLCALLSHCVAGDHHCSGSEDVMTAVVTILVKIMMTMGGFPRVAAVMIVVMLVAMMVVDEYTSRR